MQLFFLTFQATVVELIRGINQADSTSRAPTMDLSKSLG